MAKAFQFSRIDLLSRRQMPESESRFDVPGWLFRIAWPSGDTSSFSDARILRQFPPDLYSPSSSVCIPLLPSLFVPFVAGRTRMPTYKKGLFKLSIGHLNLLSKSALFSNTWNHILTTVLPRYWYKHNLTWGGVGSFDPCSFHDTVLWEGQQPIPSDPWNNDQAIYGMKKRISRASHKKGNQWLVEFGVQNFPHLNRRSSLDIFD